MMSSLEKIGKDELRDLMAKCWMTHDAMWFLHSYLEVGMEKTNKINRAAVRDMAALEVQRLKKALGWADKKIENHADLKTLFGEMFDVVKAGFMRGSVEFPEENIILLSWQQCFAHEGISRMGVIEQYQCGIFDRIDGWLKGLGVKFEVSPEVEGCMMHKEGKCFRNYKIFF